MSKSLFIFFISILNISISSQNTDEEFANYYYNQDDCEKSILYFEKIINRNKNIEILEKYSICLDKINRNNDSEKLLKKHIDNSENNYTYKFLLADHYKRINNNKSETKIYSELVSNALNSKKYNIINGIAYNFSLRQKFEHSLEIYNWAKENINETYKRSILLNIANIYNQQNKKKELIEFLLYETTIKIIDYNTIWSEIYKSINFENEKELSDFMRINCLKLIQKYPEDLNYKYIFSNYLISIKQYDIAFNQMKSIDLLKNSKGGELYNFGHIIWKNDKYDLAILIFEDIYKNVENNYSFRNASKINIARVLKDKIKSMSVVNNDDLDRILLSYSKLIDDSEINENKAELKYEYAYILIYYKNDLKQANAILNDLLAKDDNNYKAKILKADLLTIENKIWDASLLYMQVIKAKRNDIIGHEAQFKNAKIYYYTGDFDWCQTQLNSIKSSTSKLISNDAIDLSLLITSNYNMDTSTKYMNMFAKADLFIMQNNFEKANKIFDTILIENPSHSLADEILFKKYEIEFKKQNYQDAKTYLQKIINDYKDGILADNAIYYLGKLYQEHLNDNENAKKMYEKLLFEYTGSIYLIDARERFRKLTNT